MSHHNTTKEKGTLLAAYEKKAIKQEEVITAVMKQYPEKGFNASYMYKVLQHNGFKILEGSVRRALTNLKNDGLIIKTDTKVEGDHGRPQYQYKWNNL